MRLTLPLPPSLLSTQDVLICANTLDILEKELEMRKRWILIPVALVAMALAVATAGVALAHEDNGDSKSGNFTSRVAEILGQDEAEVEDAMKQAWQELRDEAMQSKLGGLVEEGRITQEQADEYLEWYQSRPETLAGFGKPGFGYGKHKYGRGFGRR